MSVDPAADAPGAGGRPVGLADIAAALGVKRATADQWRWRKLLPKEMWTIGRSPMWPWPVIEDWAVTTGRLPARNGDGNG
jgi:hypothetical protein